MTNHMLHIHKKRLITSHTENQITLMDEKDTITNTLNQNMNLHHTKRIPMKPLPMELHHTKRIPMKQLPMELHHTKRIAMKPLPMELHHTKKIPMKLIHMKLHHTKNHTEIHHTKPTHIKLHHTKRIPINLEVNMMIKETIMKKNRTTIVSVKSIQKLKDQEKFTKRIKRLITMLKISMTIR